MTANELQKSMRKAIRSGDDDRFFNLLTEHPDQLHAITVFGTWVHFAASHGRLGIVRRLIQLGIDPNAKSGVHNSAPIHIAASDGHREIVEYLLQCGAVLDVSGPEQNPLFGAIYGGHTEIAKLLIDSGIDTTVRYTGEQMKDMDARAFAKEWGRTDIVRLLDAHQRSAQR